MSQKYIDSLLISLEGIEHIYSKSLPEIEETRYLANLFEDLYVVLYYGTLFEWRMKFLLDKEIQTTSISEADFKKTLERLREFKDLVKQ